MKVVRSARWFLLALLVFLIPASSYAGVFISVGFAPPPLVVYTQPVCPQPGLMWTPGYWAYGPDGYYWVPGAWVPAPYEGALWTPGYWGFVNAAYVWHPGYWGPHVGYYGGVNYGFGYMGIGFVGGLWHGGLFTYNTAVMHVGIGGVWASHVYEDRTIVERNTVVINSRVAYSGGPGGINHPMTAQERAYTSEPHVGATRFQEQHAQQFQNDKSAYFNNNHGRPATVADARPLPAENHAAPAMRGGNEARPNTTENYRGQTPQSRPMQQARPQEQSRPQEQARPANQGRQESRPQERQKEQKRPDDRR